MWLQSTPLVLALPQLEDEGRTKVAVIAATVQQLMIREVVYHMARCSKPPTCGAAMLVPLMVVSCVSHWWPALTMLLPGAKMVRQEPTLEKLAR